MVGHGDESTILQAFVRPFDRHRYMSNVGAPPWNERAATGCRVYSCRMPTVADFPRLVREWHKTKNGPLRPKDVLAGSDRKIWWKCAKGPDHEWAAVVGNRTRKGVGCPFCAGLRACADNCLTTVAPKIARQWHPAKNAPLTPRVIVAKSNKLAWWKCSKGPDHEWRTSPAARLRGNGCPFCAGHRASAKTSLLARRPALAAEWHRTKNGDLTPANVTVGSDQKVWWRCPRNRSHEWQAPICNRSRRARTFCPFCDRGRLSPDRSNSLAVQAPRFAAQWHPARNKALTPRDITPGSGTPVWWKCRRGPDHEWRAPPRDTRSRAGCPFCSRKRVSPETSLARLVPEIAQQWHPTKNGALRPTDVTPVSSRVVWWKCPAGPDHEWRTAVGTRAGLAHKPSACNFCGNRWLSVTNSLTTVAPAIARQWHPSKNGALTPNRVRAHDFTAARWWLCPLRHSWRATPGERLRNARACPYCVRPRRRPAMTRRIREKIYFPADVS